MKIVWTLRADAVSDTTSIAHGDPRYRDRRRIQEKVPVVLARFSPGIVLIREISLRLVKKEAERRVLM